VEVKRVQHFRRRVLVKRLANPNVKAQMSNQIQMTNPKSAAFSPPFWII
jgi:hypothetical protein